MVKKVFLLIVVLGLGFAGGFLGAKLASPQEDIELLREGLDNLTDHVAAVKKEIATLSEIPGTVSELKKTVASLQQGFSRLQQEVKDLAARPAPAAQAPQTASVGVKIGFVDLGSLIDEIYAPKQSALEAQASQLEDLRKAYENDEIDKDTYTKQLLMLQVEGLKMQVDWDLSLLHKLKASFGELSGVLQQVEEKLKPLEDQVKSLEEKAKAGVKEDELQGFYSQYQQLQVIFQQLEQLLSQTLTSMLAKVAGEVAAEEGIALVVQRQDVIYVDPKLTVDLTEKVKERAPEFFGT